MLDLLVHQNEEAGDMFKFTRFGLSRTRLDSHPLLATLRRVPGFERLTARELRHIERFTCEIRVPSGRILARDGRRADQAFVLISGYLRHTEEGLPTRTLAPGAWVGASELIERTPHHGTYESTTALTVRVASRSEFPSLTAAIPDLLRLFSSPTNTELPSRVTGHHRRLLVRA